MNTAMRMLPSSPASRQLPLDIRLAADSPAAVRYRLKLDHETVAEGALTAAGRWNAARTVLPLHDRCGKHVLEFLALSEDGEILGRDAAPLEVVDSDCRATGRIDGAWCGLYHWSEEEGRLWNAELKTFTADDWRELVRGMHRLGMDIIVIQELFRNQEYYGKHAIEKDGYRGRAFYPSTLATGRMPIACDDPTEAIMSAADELGMAVLPGIGMYAWFDFMPGSLQWHLEAAREVFRRYGSHRSFYGFYISEEVFGNLHYGKETAGEIVRFFHEFGNLRNELNPAMPVMLAPNCFDVPRSLEAWHQLAKELDIICPFGFHRMAPEDIGPAKAIALFQEIADRNGAHLWLDMEAFLFRDDTALYPRPIEEIKQELASFRSFEKILCYQYPGLFNAPDAAKKPGGAETVRLFLDYREFLNGQGENS